MSDAGAAPVSMFEMARPVLLGVALPFVTSGVILLLAWRPWRNTTRPAAPLWAGAPALGVGYALGHLAVLRFPGFPPLVGEWWKFSVDGWIFWLVLLASALALVDAASARIGRIRWFGWSAVAVLAAALLTSPLIRFQWSIPAAAAWLAGISGAAVALHLSIESLASRTRGAMMPFILVVVATATSIALVLSRTASGAQLAGSLAAACGAAVLVGWWRRDLSLARGATPVAAMALSGLLVYGMFYAQLPKVSATLLLASPAAGLIGEWNWLKRRGRWVSHAVRVVCVTGVAAAAVITASVMNAHDENEYAGY